MKDSNSRGPAWEDWLVDLGRANLSGERRKGDEITICWFLGWRWTVFEPWARGVKVAPRAGAGTSLVFPEPGFPTFPWPDRPQCSPSRSTRHRTR